MVESGGFDNHHKQKHVRAKEEKKKLIAEGKTYIVTDSKGNQVEWKIVKSSKPEETLTEYENIGVRGIDFETFTQQSTYAYPYLQLLQTLWPGDWKSQLTKWNEAIDNANTRNRTSKFIKPVSEKEFWVFVGCLLSAVVFGRGGSRLWEARERNSQYFRISDQVNLSKYMSQLHFKLLKPYFPACFTNKCEKEIDEW